jgi:hypothetical protein
MENLPVVFEKKEIKKVKEKKKSYDHQSFEQSLPQGKYDIDYIINLCEIIMQKCDQLKFNPRDLEFTLKMSLKSLIAFLEFEKVKDTNREPIIHLTCSKCKFTDIVFKNNASEWKCPSCNN